MTTTKTPPQCGTQAGWRRGGPAGNGCRCTACRAWKARDMRDYREARRLRLLAAIDGTDHRSALPALTADSVLKDIDGA